MIEAKQVSAQCKQNLIVNQLTEIGQATISKLDALTKICSEFPYSSVLDEKERIDQENEELQQRVKAIQNQRELMEDKLFSLHEKLQQVKRQVGKDPLKDLENMEYLIGYKFGEFRKLHDDILEFTLHYNENYFVKFIHHEIFELVDIQPHHPNILHIREMLFTSQDVQGLLGNLRAFFELMVLKSTTNN